MKITKVDPMVLALPFTHGGPATGFGGREWTTLDYLVVRVETDEGVVGFGEGFGYNIIPATRAALTEVVAPLVLGADPLEIGPIADRLERALHLFGRSGPARYAQSALDLALWDIKGKTAGLPVHRLLGAAPRASVDAYASALWIGDPARVAREAERAAAAGFRAVKLHETDPACVTAARQAVGSAAALSVDANCAWTVAEAIEVGRRFADADLIWWEEPLWPPESAEALRQLRASVPIPLAAGENATTPTEIAALACPGGCDYIQPSVTKVGGITGFLRLAEVALAHGATLVPHSPYFGPGLLATLQLAAVFPAMPWVEYLWASLERPIYGAVTVPDETGRIAVPTEPGLGADPDPTVLSKYRVA
ncbi:MAG TPA: mandelate racemase/muconate lactonizing enzyme family protein [Amycolatopsis sp.]|nr:mandelate racemase/muconate lactonizing enzyme family protein [Amycolatopsis sp.]